MRLLSTVIYTDKLPDVREFYAKHFHVPMDGESPHAFTIFPFHECAIQFVDAGWAKTSPSQGIILRWQLPFTDLEKERFEAEGVQCSDLVVEHWSHHFGEQVRYFTITDPSGLHIQIYESHFGEKRQLMTTGDGTDTRKVQQKES